MMRNENTVNSDVTYFLRSSLRSGRRLVRLSVWRSDTDAGCGSESWPCTEKEEEGKLWQEAFLDL
jgi:hypothetical protein